MCLLWPPVSRATPWWYGGMVAAGQLSATTNASWPIEIRGLTTFVDRGKAGGPIVTWFGGTSV